MTDAQCICDHNPDTTDGPESDCPVHGWSDGPSSTDAKTIAAKINTGTADGHNLRALLLRLADGDDWRESDNSRPLGSCSDIRACAAAGSNDWLLPAACIGGFALTPLGREAAEFLRPEPWAVAMLVYGWGPCQGGSRMAAFVTDDKAFVERIAALLTADDLRAAKTYKTETGR